MKIYYRLIVSGILILGLGCVQAQQDPMDASGPGGIVQSGLFLALIGTAVAPTCEEIINPSGGKCIFVTAPHNGNFDTSADGDWVTEADEFCTAQRPAYLVYNYKAFLVSENTNRKATTPRINWVLLSNTSYYRDSDKKKIGTTNSSFLLPPTLENSLGTSGTSFWSGIDSAFTYAADTNRCISGTNWKTASSGTQGKVGHLTVTNSTYIENTTATCDSLLPIVCVQQ